MSEKRINDVKLFSSNVYFLENPSSHQVHPYHVAPVEQSGYHQHQQVNANVLNLPNLCESNDQECQYQQQRIPQQQQQYYIVQPCVAVNPQLVNQQYAEYSHKKAADVNTSDSLLCSETFTSPTPPKDESDWAQPSSTVTWTNSKSRAELLRSFSGADKLIENSLLSLANQTNQIVYDCKDKGYLLKAALLGGSEQPINSRQTEKLEKDINSNFSTKCTDSNFKLLGNDVEIRQRMSSAPNGTDRNRITGTSAGDGNSHLNRLPDGAVCHDRPQVAAAPAEGMILGHIGGTGVVPLHELGSRSILTGIVGAGPQVTVGSVFRPPQTLSDTPRYLNTYTTAPGSSEVGSFSPVYATGTHGTTLTPCGGFYSNQYPSYNSGMMHALDPQFSSYSSVLQSMGTHAAQAQVPRSPYGNTAAIGQYSLLSMAQPSSHEQEELKYRREQQDSDVLRRYSTGVLKEEKHHFSVPSVYTDTSRATFSFPLRESPSHKRELSAGGQDSYKVPLGREGSLKHRFLRPSDSSCSTTTPQQSAFINTEEPFLKRTKTDQSEAEKDCEWPICKKSESGPSGSEPNAHLQYPQHFMKGSIIQLGNGKLKRVEDLETDDFIASADVSSDLKIDSSTVVHIEENEAQGTAILGFVVGAHKVQVTVEATVEHPFFVFGQGWSSCEPARTLKRYGLTCQKLTVGDICISLTHKEVQVRAAEISRQQKEQSRADGHVMFHRDTKSESLSHDSPGQNRNRSPGCSQSPGIQSQSFTSRSELGRGESSTPVKWEHKNSSPSVSQITTSS